MTAARSLLLMAALTGGAGHASAQQEPFDRGAWAVELSGAALGEAWNYNTSREELSGMHAGLAHAVRDGIALRVGPTLWYVGQRGPDAFVMALEGGARWAVWRRGPRALTLDLAVGASRAESPVPPGGTRFNYVFHTGATFVWPLAGRARALAGASWLHLSNNRATGRGRNPDVQALGVHLGVLLPF